MWIDVNAFLLTALMITSRPVPVENTMAAPTTLSIDHLVVIAWISKGNNNKIFMRWNEAESKRAAQGLDLRESLPIVNFICKVQELSIKSCESAVTRSIFDRLYWPFLSRVRFSPSEVNLSGTQQKIVAISVTRYVDRCAETICSFTPPPPPADAE